MRHPAVDRPTGSPASARHLGVRRLLCLGLTAGLAAVSAPVVVAAAAPTGPTVDVVVLAVPGSLSGAQAAVTAAGGRVTSPLSTVDEVLATVPAAALDRLRASSAVAEVVPDVALHLLGAAYDPATDVGSTASTAAITGADAYWRAGYTGRGVDVAVIDSGVVPVDGLRSPGTVVHGPDLSSEAGIPALRHLDTFGHGTHIAGLIAGRDDGATAPYAGHPGTFTGMAPDARIVSLKIADSRGNTNLARVIAAIDWVVRHRHEGGLDIRVLNLSFGVDAGRPWTVDPLARAAAAAARAGIVVVAAAGNGGAGSTSLTDPAIAPAVIAVGAADTARTLSTADDRVASFSSGGTEGGRHPDLVAPGTHLVSLRDPGSFIDTTYSATGGVDDRFFRGSGSSQAAAVVSGAVALVLSQHPRLSAEQVRSLLTQTALPLQSQPTTRQGAGELDLGRALTASSPRPAGSSAAPAARNGEAGGAWSGSTWSGSTWSGSTWSDSTWSGSTWSGSTWSGSTWSGSTWS
jgi:serine protease AprX